MGRWARRSRKDNGEEVVGFHYGNSPYEERYPGAAVLFRVSGSGTDVRAIEPAKVPVPVGPIESAY